MKNQTKRGACVIAIILAWAAVTAVCCDGRAGEGIETAGQGARDRVLYQARQLIGVKEATGRNDGEIVEAILRSAGADKGDPWCAAFNYYVYSRAGLGGLVPRSAWSPDWVKSPTWKQGRGEQPRPGDTFGIYFQALGRVGHTGIVERWGSTVITIEGNTNGGGSRDGDGVYRRRRIAAQLYAVRSWIH